MGFQSKSIKFLDCGFGAALAFVVVVVGLVVVVAAELETRDEKNASNSDFVCYLN